MKRRHREARRVWRYLYLRGSGAPFPRTAGLRPFVKFASLKQGQEAAYRSAMQTVGM